VQFVDVAPLPGAGLALDKDGRPDGLGALQVNIPVAYTPGDGFVSFGAYLGQYIRSVNQTSWGNGTGVLGIGFFKWPRLYGSAMAVSHLVNDSKVVSVQLQVVEERGDVPAVAVGAQDLLNKEQTEFGSVANTGISFYGVVTKRFPVGKTQLYGTVGYGAARFLDTVFAGVSWPISDQFSLAAEHDGYQFNTGLGWRPWGRYSRVTFLAGYNGSAGPLVGAQAHGKMNGIWALPILLLMLKR
jgi:hypothetical protein